MMPQPESTPSEAVHPLDSTGLLQAILDSNPEQTCVLDAHGVIVGVNGAWQQFGEANGASQGTISPIGSSYRAVCEASDDASGCIEAGPAWRGIASVLEGRRNQFVLTYPCDLAQGRRWFEMTVYRLHGPCGGAVVVHHDVTARTLAESAPAVGE